MDKFLDYQNRLKESVENDDNVLGLVFAGSSADHSRVDQYSDQDFFLIVRDGIGEKFRTDLSWLPDHQQILLSPRETAHGLKVVYADGTLLEFAVFEDKELEISAVNDYLVALDKQDITERMARIAQKSVPNAPDLATDWGLFLSLILIGIGRFRRGEVLAAEQHIKSYALDRALRLIRTSAPVPESKADSFNSYRRFEQDYPELGHRLSELLCLNTEECAKGMLSIVEHAIAANTSQLNQSRVIRKNFGWN